MMKRLPLPSLVALLSATVSVTGCGEARSTGSAPVPEEVRDSAGVRLVDASLDQLQPLHLQLGATPRRTTQGGDNPFYGVVGAFMVSGNRLAVADRTASRIRFFDPSGTEVGGVGRRGEGPGEFRNLTAAGPLPGDSIWAYDFLSTRITVFGPDESVARTIIMQQPDGAPYETVVGSGDGFWMKSGVTIYPGSAQGLRRDSLTLVRVSYDGSERVMFGPFPGDERLVQIQADAHGTRTLQSLMPFSYSGLYAIAGGRLVSAASERYALTIQGADATAEARIVVQVPGQAVDGDLLRSFVGQDLSGPDSAKRAARSLRSIETMPLHETAPEIDALVGASDGGFWVRRDVLPGDTEATWVVHAPDGAPRGTLRAPAGLRITAIGTSSVVGVTRSDMDVESVVVYPLSSGSR